MRHNKTAPLFAREPLLTVPLKGNKKTPHFRGEVRIYSWAQGVLVRLEAVNLPLTQSTVSLQITQSSRGQHTASSKDVPSPCALCVPLHCDNGYCFTVFYTALFTDADIADAAVSVHCGSASSPLAHARLGSASH